MGYNLDFLISALVFLMLILFHFINRKRPEDSNSRIFSLFILLGITDITFDIITTILISYRKPELSVLTFITLTFFYFLQILVPYALFLYSRTLYTASPQRKNTITLILSVPAFFMAAMVLYNCWSGIFFSIDIHGNYIKGVFYLGMYCYAGLYGIIILICSLCNYQRLGSKKFMIICEFLVIMGICVAIQGVRNDILTTGLGLGLGIAVLYLTINNPSGFTDYLTGDFNIQSFLNWLHELFRRRKNFHIISVNIRNLEQINMLYGIRTGDHFLCIVSSKLHDILCTPYIFRVSSKRFVLLTYSLREYERVRDEVRSYFNSSISLNGEQIQLNAIICGIVNAQKLKDNDTLLSYIDYLSLLAPASTDTILIQNDENTMNSFQYNKEIERFLLTAIADDLFEIQYQPVFSMKKPGIVSLEALSRLHHPTLGSVPPDIFIAIAERNGLIAQIGLLQFRRICTFVKEHPELQSKIDHINVNLSPAELLRDGYSQKIISIIREYSIPFSFFQLEITETVATEYSDRLYQLTEDFNRHGISLNLDDFGSGYANLNTVLKLPFSCIKLDKSLLNGILDDVKTEKFYKSIVTALKSLGYDIISEGVECIEEVDLLESFGIDMMQGYYFSKPVSADKLLNLLGIDNTTDARL